MQALISGQAGLAVCIRGNSASVIRADEAGEETGYTVASVRMFLGGATDVVVLQEPSESEIRQLLNRNWSIDCALRLFPYRIG